MRFLRRLSERLIENRAGAGAYSAGKVLARRAKYRLAAEAFADAEVAFKKHYGDDHDYVTQARLNRPWCYLKLHRCDESIALYESILRAEEVHVDNGHPRIVAILQKLAEAYDESGQTEKADQIRVRMEQ